MPLRNLILVTAGATAPRYSPVGWIDTPSDLLTIEEAKDIARQLTSHAIEFDQVYSAPATRTVQLAAALIGASADCDKVVVKCGGLVDRHWGGLVTSVDGLPVAPKAADIYAATAAMDAKPSPQEVTAPEGVSTDVSAESLDDVVARVKASFESTIFPALASSTHGVVVVCDPVVLRVLAVVAGAAEAATLIPAAPTAEVVAAAIAAAEPIATAASLPAPTADSVAAFFAEYGYVPTTSDTVALRGVAAGRRGCEVVVYALDACTNASSKTCIGALDRVPLDINSGPLAALGAEFVDAELGGTIMGPPEYDNGPWLLANADAVVTHGRTWLRLLDSALEAAGGEDELRSSARAAAHPAAPEFPAVAGGWFAPMSEHAKWQPQLQGLFEDARGALAVYKKPSELVTRFARICRHDAERIWRSPRMREVHCRALLGLAPADPHSAGERHARTRVAAVSPLSPTSASKWDTTTDGTMGPGPIGTSFVVRTGNYFQPASFVLALLRLGMPLGDAVRCLSTIATVDKYLPGHYVEESAGNHVDCLIAVDVARAHVEDVAKHLFDTLGYPYQAFMPKWFSALCVPLLPYDLQMRYMDAFCEHGVVFLFRFVVAVFRTLRESLLSRKSASDVSPILSFKPTAVSRAELEAIVDAAVADRDVQITPEDLLRRRHEAFNGRVRNMLERTREMNAAATESESEEDASDEEDEEDCVGCGGAPAIRCEVREFVVYCEP